MILHEHMPVVPTWLAGRRWIPGGLTGSQLWARAIHFRMRAASHTESGIIAGARHELAVRYARREDARVFEGRRR
jgi:hypothetical protein